MNDKELYNHYTINVNVYELIQEAYREYFNRGINVIGCSSVAFCAKKILIIKLFFPGYSMGNMKMLHGKIHHEVIQKPQVLNPLCEAICDILGFNKKKMRITPELKFRIEIKPDVPYTGRLKGQKTYMEGHIDVYTNFFLIEIKTTDVLPKFFDEMKTYHFIQTTAYLGHSKPKTDDDNKISLAYLLKINLTGYRDPIEDINEIWNKHGKIPPIIFNQKIFDKIIERVKLIFKMIDMGKYNLAGPEFPNWECKICDKKVKNICQRNLC